MRLTDLDRINRQKHNPRVIALWRALQPLRSCVSFMNTGAHPDDETSPMLAALELRDGVKLSHACSTRGEGGQNVIGLEVTKDLGVVRTREMEAAAKVLNMTHYWLSATSEDSIFDFGFSKSGIETLGYWDEQRTLERFVLILRRERPDIVCPTFLDIPGQHGHHRAMTQSAFKAVLLAADKNAFPEQNLDVWQVKKLYLPAWSGAGDAYDDDLPPPPETTQIDASGFDAVLGADYAQIGEWSREFHRTQGMGTWVQRGQQSVWPLNLAWAENGKLDNEVDIFASLPKTLGNLAEFAKAPGLNNILVAAQNEMNMAIKAWPNDFEIRNHTIAALKHLRKAKQECPDEAKSEILHRLKNKEISLAKVLFIAEQIDCQASLSRREVRPGEDFTISLNLFAPELNVSVKTIVPDGWHAGPWQNDKCIISVPDDARVSDHYPDTWHPGQANEPVHLRLSWLEDEQEISLSVDLEERLQVLPSHTATTLPSAALINLSVPNPIEIALSNKHPQNAVSGFKAQDGWEISGTGDDYILSPKPGLAAGLYKFELALDDQPAQTLNRMNYDHTGPLVRAEPASINVCALNVTLPDARIAYIGGGSERADYWMRALGMQIITLDDRALEQTDFSEFDSVLVGVFAFRTRPVLAHKLNALYDWVRSGGNLVTLYHRPWDNWDPKNTPPAYLKIGKPSLRWRITDEKAKVTHLDPNHPLLNTPNKITQDDWMGWQKERGLYFAAEWAPDYKSLLSMSDPDEAPLEGALLSAKIGKGRHTHTSLILHYQLEKLVPGAYRILANLLNPV